MLNVSRRGSRAHIAPVHPTQPFIRLGPSPARSPSSGTRITQPFRPWDHDHPSFSVPPFSLRRSTPTFPPRVCHLYGPPSRSRPVSVPLNAFSFHPPFFHPLCSSTSSRLYPRSSSTYDTRAPLCGPTRARGRRTTGRIR